MGNDRKLPNAMVIENEAHAGRDLMACVLGAAQRGVGIWFLLHLGIAIGESESMKIKSPDVKAGRAQGIAP